MAVATVGLVAVGAVFHFVPPALPAAILDLGIDHGRAGLLMSLFALPGLLLSLPGGWLVDRVGDGRTALAGLAAMGAATVALAAADALPWILVLRGVSGIGALLAVVALQRRTVRLFTGRPLGVPLGLAGSAIPLGVILVLSSSGALLERGGWRLVGTAAGGFALLAALLSAVSGLLLARRGRQPQTAAAAARGQVPTGSLRLVWTAGAIWICSNGAATSFMTFAPDFLADHGYAAAVRGQITSVPMWISALLGPLVGLLADRRGGKRALVAAGMGLMGVTLAAVPLPGVSPLLAGAGLGLALGLMTTPLLSLVAESLPASHQGLGFGILSMCGNLGIFAVPPLMGWVRDATGGYGLPYLLMGGVALSGLLVAESLRRRR